MISNQLSIRTQNESYPEGGVGTIYNTSLISQVCSPNTHPPQSLINWFEQHPIRKKKMQKEMKNNRYKNNILHLYHTL